MQPSWGPRVFWFCVFLLIVAAVFAWFYEPVPSSELEGISDRAFRESPVTISPQLIGCELQVGVGDQEPTLWKGEIRLSKGKLLQAIPLRTGKQASVAGDQFELSSVRESQLLVPALLRCALLADGTDSLVISLGKEKKVVALSELQEQKTIELFDGKAKLVLAAPVQEMHHDSANDDVLPYLTTDQKGDQYLAYLNCERGKPIDSPAVLKGNFDTLQHPILGVTVRLSRFQQGTWSNAENVTGMLDAALDPVVALDQQGRIFVAWAQPGSDGWDIYYRTKTPAAQLNSDISWSEPQKVTDHPGSVHHLVAATDAKGKIWLVWQTWHYDHYEIFATVINDDTHAWHTPGPVADHDRDSEGRWHPALTTDSLGNVFIAWSQFRQGHFDVEMVKLAPNAPKPAAQVIATSLSQEGRPTVACDSRNQLWIAYEESEADQGSGDKGQGAEILPHPSPMPPHPAKIHVRLLDSQQQLYDLPAAPSPPSISPLLRGVSGGAQSPFTCSQPNLLISSNNVPILTYRYQQKLYFTALSEQAWSEPQELAPLNSPITSRIALTYHADHIAVYTDGLDLFGRSRLYVGAQKLPSVNQSTFSKKLVGAEQLKTSRSPDWDRFQENVRLFRGRPQDPEMANKHLLRGLIFLPTNRTTALEQMSTTTNTIEKLLCDWVLFPGSAEDSPCKSWVRQLEHQALAQKSERALLSGYYRSPPQSGEPALIIQNRLDFAPLPTQSRLYSLLADQESSLRTTPSREADARMLEQYLVETKDLGFNLLSDWLALATHNPPDTTMRIVEGAEGVLMPLWRPQATNKATQDLNAIRLIAYANGKSPESLMEAIRDRQYYLATDDVYLLARCDKRVPGEVFQTARVPVITVQAQGTGKIAKVEVWRDNKLMISEEPPGAAAVLECPDKETDRRWHFYLVRIIQANGAMAVTQPFWIRYQP